MKLPALGKKERTMLLAFAGILVVAGIYAAIQYGILPQIKSYKSAKAEEADYASKVAEGYDKLKKKADVLAQNEAVKKNLLDIYERYTMKPVFGNYKYEAQKLVNDIATNKAGVEISGLSEVWPLQDPPAPNGRFRAYTLKLTAVLSYEELMTFFDEIERNNPYATIWEVSVTPLSVDAQNVAPRHTISFSVSWPVWIDGQKSPDDIRASLVPVESPGETPVAGKGADKKS